MKLYSNLKYFGMSLTTVFTNERVIFTLTMIFIIRFLTYIPVPGVDAKLVEALYEKNNQILGFFNSISGGSLSRLAISSLYLGPYIQASILMRVISTAFEPFKNLQKDSYRRKELNKYQKMLTLIIAIIQASIMVQLTQRMAYSAIIEHSISFKFFSILILASTSIIIGWIADRIRTDGIGGGASIVIFASIASNASHGIFQNLAKLVRSGEFFYLLTIGGVFVLLIVFFENTIYRIPLFFKRAITIKEEERSYNTFPIKINPAGILPAMFADNMMTIVVYPINFIAGILIGNGYVFSEDRNALLILKTLLVASLYTICLNFSIDSEEVKDQMQSKQSYFDKIREGMDTVNYMNHLLFIISIVGVFYSLCVLILPDFIALLMNIKSLKGTSILLLVITSIEIFDRCPKFVDKS